MLGLPWDFACPRERGYARNIELVIPDGQSLIEKHLRQRAHTYWHGEGDLANLRLIRKVERPAARLYWYEVQGAGGRHRIVVKVHTGTGHAHSTAVRALRAAEEHVPNRYEREVVALTRLNEHFAALADLRFGTIPILDAIPSARAIVTEHVVGVPMTSLFVRASRLYPGGSGALDEAIVNAGGWLGAWQTVSIPNLITRRSTRAEFVDLVARYCDFLAQTVGDADRFAHLRTVASRAAHRLFPADLPLAVGHGDFAMRNILVRPAGGVVVLDTLGVWEAPIYEDLATFALAARLFRAQAYLAGIPFGEPLLRKLEKLLLEGYGERLGEVQNEQVDLYSLLLLLDTWASTVVPARHRSRGPIRVRLLTRWYAREMDRLLSRTGTAGPSADGT